MATLAPSPLAEARSLHAVGDLRRATELYRDALAVEPGNVIAMLGLSLIARQTGQAGAALRMASAAVEANPENPLARTTLAHAHLAQGEREKAKEELREALRLSPYEIPALLALGDLLTAEACRKPLSSRAVDSPQPAAGSFRTGQLAGG
jgi:tetratricopeptide (TPR) repeat protein